MPEAMTNFSEIGNFHGRKVVRVSEKSNFSQTCSMLSQYLKERGSFGDLISLGMTCINLDEKEKSEEVFCQSTEKKIINSLLPNKVKSMDLFPQEAGFGPTLSMEDVPKKAADFSEIMPVKEQETTAQMTMFYAGKVLVFDNFPPNKVKEIMQLARNLTSSAPQSNGSSASTTSIGNDQLNSSGAACLNASTSNFPSVSGIKSTKENFQAKLSNLPIARKASLHRFLEKRKDRISTRAPYQVNNSSGAPPAKAEENKMWLGLASESSRPFEL